MFRQLPRTYILTEKDTIKSVILEHYGNLDLMVRICEKCGHISLFSKAVIEKSHHSEG